MFYTRILLALCACFFIPNLYAQSIADTTIYIMAEQMPQYPGGNDSLLKEITAQVIYPEQCSDSNIQGKVYLRFVVNTDGSIADVHAVKSPHPLLSAAAIAATVGLKKFKPGMQQGKPVRVWYSVPVSFKVKTAEIAFGALQVDTRSVFDFYAGGYAGFSKDMADNTVFPQVSKDNKLEAFIKIECRLADNLKLTPLKVLNDVDSIFTGEAVRAINLTRPFDEKIRNTSLVGTMLYVTIAFVFNEEHPGIDTSLSKILDKYIDEGTDYFEKGEYTSAINSFNAALKHRTAHADAFYRRARAKQKLHDMAGACADFKRALLLGSLEAKNDIKLTCQ